MPLGFLTTGEYREDFVEIIEAILSSLRIDSTALDLLVFEDTTQLRDYLYDIPMDRRSQYIVLSEDSFQKKGSIMHIYSRCK